MSNGTGFSFDNHLRNNTLGQRNLSLPKVGHIRISGGRDGTRRKPFELAGREISLVSVELL
jgi:hypothetical protein